MGLGKIIYNIYYRPLAGFNRTKKFGIINFLRIEYARRQMVSAAYDLKEINKPDLPVHSVYILTGKKYWYQTAFCLYSLQKVSGNIQFNATLVDDGSFDEALVKQIRSQFPSIKIQRADETESRLLQHLPATRYPALHKKRKSYPHIRKLIDVHAGQTGWKMVIDSDMLFFKEPKLVEDWLKKPATPFFLQDINYAYYYTTELMANLTGKPVSPNLNVGMIGIKSESINWDNVESWIVDLEAREGTNYLLEQALSAMIVAGEQVLVSPKNDYIVLPNEEETKFPQAVLHHYVAESKEWYFKNAWRLILKDE